MKVERKRIISLALALAVASAAALVGAVGGLGTRTALQQAASTGNLAASHDADMPANHSTAMLVPAPTTLDELLSKSDIVVVARVVRHIDSFRMAPYNEAEARTESPTDKISPRIDVSDFDVRPIRVLRSDVSSLESITLRLPGAYPDATDPLSRMPTIGKTYLYFLMRNPDGTYGPYHGPWGRVDITGPTVRYLDARGPAIPFAVDWAPGRFMAEIEQR